MRRGRRDRPLSGGRGQPVHAAGAAPTTWLVTWTASPSCVAGSGPPAWRLAAPRDPGAPRARPLSWRGAATVRTAGTPPGAGPPASRLGSGPPGRGHCLGPATSGACHAHWLFRHDAGTSWCRRVPPAAVVRAAGPSDGSVHAAACRYARAAAAPLAAGTASGALWAASSVRDVAAMLGRSRHRSDTLQWNRPAGGLPPGRLRRRR
mmetsp:Transcript_139925/g.390061  ORF Transcript_139925/g.390061 Transcript_139925/m.390061 type:complete len:206 (-) Transcript_139925:265-882(-)